MATKRYVPVVLVAVVLGIAGLVADPIPAPMGWEDKACHAAGFFALALALRAAMPSCGWPLALALAAGLGGLIELAQMLRPLRTASWADLAGDLAGFALGWALSRLALGRPPPEIGSPGERA